MDARRYADLRNRLAGDEGLNRPLWAEHKLVVLEYCDSLGELTAFDVQRLFDHKSDTVAKMLLIEMYEEGFLERDKDRPYSGIYSLTDYGREKLATLGKKE